MILCTTLLFELLLGEFVQTCLKDNFTVKKFHFALKIHILKDIQRICNFLRT